MSFEVIKFPFNVVAGYAKRFSRKESPKASRIWDFLTDRSIRDYLNLCYTYLRWADDIVDNPDLPIEDKKKFIEHQKNLILSLYNNNFAETSLIEEACIIYFAEYALSSGNLILLDEVKNMIEALRMDVYRLECSGVFSNDDLNYYIELMSKSFFNILCVFAFPKSKYRKEFYLGMKFTTIALMIRDLEEDIDIGYINIGAGEIERYKLSVSNLKNDKNLSHWLADRIKQIFEILYEETALLKYLPVKFKIFTYYSLIYRLPPVVRTKVYNYNLEYISGKKILLEIKTYVLSFFISINIFIKGFLFTAKKVEVKKDSSSADKISRPASLKEAFRISRNYTRKRAPKLWMISYLLIPEAKRKYVFLCFSYLRWVDDFVDNPFSNKKLEFVENQLNLITVLTKSDSLKYDDLQDELKSKEEFFLYYCIEYAKSNGNYNLIYEGRRNIEAIRMDAVRLANGGLFSNEELNLYIENLVAPIFNLSYYLFSSTEKIENNNEYLGKFLQYVLMLRDFFEDLDSGYINMTAEEVEKFNLDINNIRTDNNRFAWARYKYSECIKILKEDINIFKTLPLKLKLFWSPIYPYIIYDLIKIKFYDFNFGVKNKKEFSKEVKIFFAAFSWILKFYLNVFLRINFKYSI